MREFEPKRVNFHSLPLGVCQEALAKAEMRFNILYGRITGARFETNRVSWATPSVAPTRKLPENCIWGGVMVRIAEGTSQEDFVQRMGYFILKCDWESDWAIDWYPCGPWSLGNQDLVQYEYDVDPEHTHLANRISQTKVDLTKQLKHPLTNEWTNENTNFTGYLSTQLNQSSQQGRGIRTLVMMPIVGFTISRSSMQQQFDSWYLQVNALSSATNSSSEKIGIVEQVGTNQLRSMHSSQDTEAQLVALKAKTTTSPSAPGDVVEEVDPENQAEAEENGNENESDHRRGRNFS